MDFKIPITEYSSCVNLTHG